MLKYDLSYLDYFELIKKSKSIDISKTKKIIKVAILADFATQQFSLILKTLFYLNEIQCEIYEADFDSIELEVYNQNSGLYSFDPDTILILNSTQKLKK